MEILRVSSKFLGLWTLLFLSLASSRCVPSVTVFLWCHSGLIILETVDFCHYWEDNGKKSCVLYFQNFTHTHTMTTGKFQLVSVRTGLYSVTCATKKNRSVRWMKVLPQHPCNTALQCMCVAAFNSAETLDGDCFSYKKCPFKPNTQM